MFELGGARAELKSAIKWSNVFVPNRMGKICKNSMASGVKERSWRMCMSTIRMMLEITMD